MSLMNYSATDELVFQHSSGPSNGILRIIFRHLISEKYLTRKYSKYLIPLKILFAKAP